MDVNETLINRLARINSILTRIGEAELDDPSKDPRYSRAMCELAAIRNEIEFKIKRSRDEVS